MAERRRPRGTLCALTPAVFCVTPVARSRLEAAQRFSTAVVCNHPDDFSIFAELHELGRLRVFLIDVAKHHARQSGHDLQEFKVQVRICFKAPPEVVTQSCLAPYGSRWIAQYLRR